MNEMPQMMAATSASQLYDGVAVGALPDCGDYRVNLVQQQSRAYLDYAAQIQNVHAVASKEIKMSASRRLIQVFIADPNESVPLENAVLFRGEQKLTDLTDQELFFEIPTQSLLAEHNEKRIKLQNKAIKERSELLEPARIRDLKMVVVTIASF